MAYLNWKKLFIKAAVNLLQREPQKNRMSKCGFFIFKFNNQNL